MYKDKDKQREANRQASQRRRDKAKGMTQSITKGMTVKDEPSNVIPSSHTLEQPSPLEVVEDFTTGGVTDFEDLSDAAKHRVDNLVEAGVVRPTEVYAKPQSYNPMMVGYVPPKD